MALNCSIDDLPTEVLECILHKLLPYLDLQSCKLVNKRWYSSVQNVVRRRKLNFNRAILNFNTQWDNYENTKSVNEAATISRRYSHSACTHGNDMYVFGGCTFDNTTFNDFWRLDLSTRKWHRMVTLGSYPCPKASASLVYYNNTFVLFGGWRHFGCHPQWIFHTFDELHVYDMKENRWSLVVPTTSIRPSSLAAHSASVHGDEMVVYGGLNTSNMNSPSLLWSLNLKSYEWTCRITTENGPQTRFSHSQIALDNDRLLIIGGYSGRKHVNMRDVWMLTMIGPVWTWTAIDTCNVPASPNNLWCHPACKVGDKVVVLSWNPEALVGSVAYSSWADAIKRPIRSEPRPRPDIDRDVNVNGQRGFLIDRKRGSNFSQNVPMRNHMNMSAFREKLPQKNREKQLDFLRRMEERIKNKTIKPVHVPVSKSVNVSKMAMFVLDISNIKEKIATWLPVKQVSGDSPDPTAFYSLVEGHSELIMFGGIRKTDQHEENFNAMANGTTVTDTLHFITAPGSEI